jgi:hypothetical protein
MIIELMRFLYSTWALGVIILVLHGLSRLLFSRKPFLEKVEFLITCGALAVAWPIAVFSPEGRKILWRKIDHL